MRRTKSKKLSQDSLDEIKKLLRSFGWSFVETPSAEDYGVDGLVEFFKKAPDEEEEIQSYFARGQLKASSVSKNVNFDLKHIKYWNDQPVPFYLFLYFEHEKKFYWVDLQKHYARLETTSPEKLEQKNISILFSNVLDDDSNKIIENDVKQSCDMASYVIKENKRKKMTLVDLPIDSGKPTFAKAYISAPTVAMGYDFSNKNLENTDLRGSSLMGANFSSSQLRNANLGGAAVMGASFEKADLKNSNLGGTAFMGAFLKGADFRGSKLDKMSKWSISKAYDYESAMFDPGIIEEINRLKKIDNYNFPPRLNLSYDLISYGDGKKHTYRLRIDLNNTTSQSLEEPKLEIIMPEPVIDTVSSRGVKKRLKSQLVKIHFEKLEVSKIHPGQELTLMPTPNIDLIYFMNSDLHDCSSLLNAEIKVTLFVADCPPVITKKVLKDLQRF